MRRFILIRRVVCAVVAVIMAAGFFAFRNSGGTQIYDGKYTVATKAESEAALGKLAKALPVTEEKKVVDLIEWKSVQHNMTIESRVMYDNMKIDVDTKYYQLANLDNGLKGNASKLYGKMDMKTSYPIEVSDENNQGDNQWGGGQGSQQTKNCVEKASSEIFYDGGKELYANVSMNCSDEQNLPEGAPSKNTSAKYRMPYGGEVSEGVNEFDPDFLGSQLDALLNTNQADIDANGTKILIDRTSRNYTKIKFEYSDEFFQKSVADQLDLPSILQGFSYNYKSAYCIALLDKSNAFIGIQTYYELEMKFFVDDGSYTQSESYGEAAPRLSKEVVAGYSKCFCDMRVYNGEIVFPDRSGYMTWEEYLKSIGLDLGDITI